MNQYHHRGEEQAPAEEIADKQHGCEHHEMSPVVDAAVDTAAIFHNKGLEGTEEQNADIVTEKEKHRQHE